MGQLKIRLKRKLPATFNAVEYETERVLCRLDEQEKCLLQTAWENKRALTEIMNQLGDMSHTRTEIERLSSEIAGYSAQTKQLEKLLNESQKRAAKYRAKPTLRLELHLVEHCNLNCHMCSHFSCIAKEEFLDLSIFEKDMQRLAKLFDNGVEQIKLLGGEPLLHPRIGEFLKIARSYFPENCIKVLTNGTLLPAMGEDFWNVCRETGTVVNCTEYPTGFDYSKVKRLAADKNVRYEAFNQQVKTMHHFPLNLSGAGNAVYNFESCYMANNDCVTLYHGRVYTCTVAANARHFKKFFNAPISLSPRDSIDIYTAKDASEITEFLAKPIPFCRFCDVRRRTYSHSWSAAAKHTIDEWTI